MKMRAIPALIISAAVIFAACAGARCKEASGGGAGFEIVPIWSHVHTDIRPDDGGHSPVDTVKYMRSKNYRGLILTPHSRTGLPFPEVRERADTLNADDFIVVAGREVAARIAGERDREGGRLMCHLNAVSDTDDIIVRDNDFDSTELEQELAKLDEEGAFYWWNHPWSCPMWKPEARRFYGIEIFNTVGPGHSDGSAYETAKTAYLESLRAGKKLFVTSGIDMHVLAQSQLADYYTYVFPDEFSRESLVAAMTAGRTIAGFNARILFISARPSFASVPAPGNTFKISGGVAINAFSSAAPTLVIYKNGVEHATAEAPVIERRGKSSKGYFPFEISFGDTLAPGESACYVFEIPRYMFSSPYCFAAEN